MKLRYKLVVAVLTFCISTIVVYFTSAKPLFGWAGHNFTKQESTKQNKVVRPLLTDHTYTTLQAVLRGHAVKVGEFNQSQDGWDYDFNCEGNQYSGFVAKNKSYFKMKRVNQEGADYMLEYGDIGNSRFILEFTSLTPVNINHSQLERDSVIIESLVDLSKRSNK